MGGFGFDGYGFSLMETLFPVMFFAVFALIIGTFIVFLVKGLSQWSKNNASPVLTVEAKVVTKRADVSNRLDSDSDGMTHRHNSTSYYVTFQVESGDRMELHVPDQEFGLLVEGDRGRLTFQGTRYHGFVRYGVD